MSGEEDQAIRAFFDSWMLRDDEVTDEALKPLVERFATPDVTYQEDPAWPGAATTTGSVEVAGRLREYREILGRPIVAIEALQSAGDGRWAAAVRIGGESASGAPWDHLWGYTFEMFDGRIKAFRAYFDAPGAFAAVGLAFDVTSGAA